MPPVPPAGRRDCRCPRARHQHGTNAAYSRDRCRCEPCARANSRAQKLNRTRIARVGPRSPHTFVDPQSAALMLQALAAVGWSANDLAAMLGTSGTNVIRWRRGGRHAAMQTPTERRIRAVYDATWDKPPPGRYAVRVRNIARRNGWLSPLDLEVLTDSQKEPIYNSVRVGVPADIDEIAVERAVRGEPVRLNRAELSEARVSLERMGMSAREIAARLGVTPRTVQRARAQRRQDAAA